MDVREAIRKRRSIRKFKEDAVSDVLVMQLLESARLAPSGLNVQPWEFIVVRDATIRQKLQASSYGQPHVGHAPVILACCANAEAFGGIPQRIEELIAAGAFPEKSREICAGMFEKGASTAASSSSASQTRDQGEAKNVQCDRDDGTQPSLITMAVVNTCLAIEHIVLQAVELGLGTCWILRFNVQQVKEILDIPENREIIALLPIGYPDEDPPQRPRFDLEKIYYYEKYGNRKE